MKNTISAQLELKKIDLDEETVSFEYEIISYPWLPNKDSKILKVN
jgi:hypothetical protein